jgi:hypothetical protein
VASILAVQGAKREVNLGDNILVHKFSCDKHEIEKLRLLFGAALQTAAITFPGEKLPELEVVYWNGPGIHCIVSCGCEPVEFRVT